MKVAGRRRLDWLQGSIMHHFRTLAIAATVLLLSSLPTTGDAPENVAKFTAMRAHLVDRIIATIRQTADVTGIAELNPSLIEALREVPRHAFVPEELTAFAYLDMALPVGHEQNISQPFLVALMLQLAEISPGDIVFETGTGAGYQAALLSRLGAHVYSAEVVAPLADRAAERLKQLGYPNIEVRHADGFYGWKERAPFDAILIKEAIHHVPAPLLNQLRPGGRLVAPVGPLDGSQMLTLIEKGATGEITETKLLSVKFSPLQGGERI